MSRDTIRCNLIEAIRLVEAEPVLELDQYLTETTCGTLYCTAGLLAQQPYFQRQGMRLSQDEDWGGLSIGTYFLTIGHRELFGDDAFDRLFASSKVGVWDDELIRELEAPNEDAEPTKPRPTDKQLALARLRRQLDLYQ
mgnify:CR=1 FL=1